MRTYSWSECAPSPTAPRPSRVGTPRAPVKFPSEPPPAMHSPSERFICFARDLARENDAAHVGRPQGPQIEYGAGAFGNHVRARAALDDVGVNADAPSWDVPRFDARKLRGQLVYGIDALFRSEARVGSAPLHDQFGFSNALARRFDQPSGTEGRLEHEDGIAAACLGFEEFARGFAADLLVRCPYENKAFGWTKLGLLKRLERKECLDDASFHVEGSRPVSFS